MDTLVVDQATLNEQATVMLVGQSLADTPLGSATVREVAVQLDDGRALITGQVKAGFLTLPFSLTATVSVAAERPIVHVQDLAVGGIGVPDVARQGVESRIQAEVDQALAQQSYRVQAVTIQPGTVTVSGRSA